MSNIKISDEMIQAGIEIIFEKKNIGRREWYLTAHMDLTAAKEVVKNLYLAMNFEEESSEELINQSDNAKKDEDFIRQGDVLLVKRLSGIDIIRRNLIRSPGIVAPEQLVRNHHIVNGIEFDIDHHKVAYWIGRKDRPTKRLPIFGKNSGKRLVWLLSKEEANDYVSEDCVSIVDAKIRSTKTKIDSMENKEIKMNKLKFIPQHHSNKMYFAYKILKFTPTSNTNQYYYVSLEKQNGADETSTSVTPKWINDNKAKIGGYYVGYSNGAIGYKPAEYFETVCQKCGDALEGIESH